MDLTNISLFSSADSALVSDASSVDGTLVPDTAATDGALVPSTTSVNTARSAHTHSLSVVESMEVVSPTSLSDLSEGTTTETSFLGFPQQPEGESSSPSLVGHAPPALQYGESKRAARRKRHRLAKEMGALTLSATPDLEKGGAPEVHSPSTKRGRSPGGTPDSQVRNHGKKPRVRPGSYASILKKD